MVNLYIGLAIYDICQFVYFMYFTYYNVFVFREIY